MPQTVSEVYNSIKAATVAIVASYPERLPNRPFQIIGSGFCIRPEGVVVTCKHVFEFFSPEAVAGIPGKSKPRAIPQAMFFGGVEGTQIIMHSASIVLAGMENGFDLAVLRLGPHPAFPDGYPIVPILDFADVHEMMDIATCGYPLGEVLHEQLGTVTSSFTKGMISSIIPAPGIGRQHVKGFQLDLTATNGNSGGPVFSVENGRVFGVLQGGAIHPATGHVVQGLTKGEPVYPLLDSGIIEKLLRGQPPVS